jgi:YggT family protein
VIVVTVVATIAHYLLLVYVVILFARLVVELLRSFARGWRPRGLLLVVTELVYSLTDPPIRAARRIVKPVRVGGMLLDLAFSVVLLVVYVLMYITAVIAGL